jgi:hypothetical protein
MKNLLELLQTSTADLLTEFVQMSAEWAETKWNRTQNYNESQWKRDRPWISAYGSDKKNVRCQQIEMVHTTKSLRKWQAVVAIQKTPLEKYIQEAKDAAFLHYISSLQKLATRLGAMDFQWDNLKVGTAKIDQNITTTISDGTKTVKAWTIIAQGDIQRPHYRYLIK